MNISHLVDEQRWNSDGMAGKHSRNKILKAERFVLQKKGTNKSQD